MNSPTKARHQDYQIETGNLNMDHALDSISAPLKGKCKNLHAKLFILLRLYYFSSWEQDVRVLHIFLM